MGGTAAPTKGNPQIQVRRKVGTYDIVEGQILGIPMEVGILDLNCITLQVNAVLDVTVGANAVYGDAPTQLIKRVELIGNGKDTIASVPFNFLAVGNAFRHARQTITPPSGVAVATYDVAATGNLDLFTPDGVRPKDTALHLNQYGTMRLRLTFGYAADCFNGGTVSLSSGTVDVFVWETVELTPAGQNEPRYVRKVSYQEIDITASNTNLLIQMPTENQIRAVQLYTTDAGDPVDTIINNVKLYSGVDVRFDLAADHIKAINEADYAAWGNSGVPTGYYVGDFCADGRLTNAWDLRGITQAFASLDVTSVSATSKLYVAVTELIG